MISALFDLWNRHKQRIDRENKRLFFHEREVWWAQIGKNIGFEQDGKNQAFTRPVLVLTKFNRQVFWGVPLTTQEKTGKYYYPVTVSGSKTQSIAILSQLRLFDAKRLKDKIGEAAKEDFLLVKQKIARIIVPDDS